MTDQIIERVAFHPQQCPKCNHYVRMVHQCRGFINQHQPEPKPAVFNGVSRETCPRFEPNHQPRETLIAKNTQQQSSASTLVRGEAKIFCPKCKTENPPGSERCMNCDANLLPSEGAAERLAYLVGGILVAASLGYLFYRFYVLKPGTAPDFVLCNPGALGFGAVIVFFTAFIQAFRKTPTFLKFENRARRHIDLNPWQSLSDINEALDSAPAKEHSRLLKQRAALYEKIGLKDEAARDHLALVTSPDAFKGESEWVSALTGADGDTYANSRRSGQISSLLQSGNVMAIGYCPKCQRVVELNSDQHCQVHPKTKGSSIQYFIPADVGGGLVAVLQELEPRHPQLKVQLTELLDKGQGIAVGYCPRCKAAVELNSARHCPIHLGVRGRNVQYVLPKNINTGKRAVHQARRGQQPLFRKRRVMTIAFILAGIALIYLGYSAEISGFIQNLIQKLP